jgi:hypothetical protein
MNINKFLRNGGANFSQTSILYANEQHKQMSGFTGMGINQQSNLTSTLGNLCFSPGDTLNNDISQFL